ncbi:MAG: sn-glycerol-3-phosphate ABC transporter ATP-binding protein UgpC [Alphaproteobacteria bacterium]|nr:sn-glycerol-3-phosphate ABC transporter ATP-binding protein UgpC [Alphaproteobacteria bacterium]
MASLSFRAIQKSYGSTKVLHHVDVQVGDGEYLVLVGPSGCGKSTLLRCIAGLEDISAGELWIGDRRVDQMAPRDRNVAMVFQSYALYPHMTVRENMGFALRVQRRPPAEIEAAVLQAAKMLELEHLLDRYPGQMSGGQRQRVAMGRAIVRRPDVFLFDEPLSNLDAALRHHMRVELKRLHRRLETTIVHVTHDQVEALTLADRILVLNGGYVQQFGSPRELFDTPANTFVAQFIGSPSMNLLPAVGSGGEVRIEGVEGALALDRSGPFTLGVRPTDLVVGSGPLKGRVDVIESMGAEALLHIELGPHTIVAQVPEPLRVRVDELVPLDVGVTHAFDRESGVRL